MLTSRVSLKPWAGELTLSSCRILTSFFKWLVSFCVSQYFVVKPWRHWTKLVGLQNYDGRSSDHLASDTERIWSAMNSSLSSHNNITTSHDAPLSLAWVLGKVFILAADDYGVFLFFLSNYSNFTITQILVLLCPQTEWVVNRSKCDVKFPICVRPQQ